MSGGECRSVKAWIRSMVGALRRHDERPSGEMSDQRIEGFTVAFDGGEEMKKKDGITRLIYVGGGLPETTLMEDAPILFIAQFREDTAGIAPPVVVNSQEELCSRFEVRMIGEVSLPGRKTEWVEIPVRGADTFELNGMTVSCRPLLIGYASGRALEAYHRYLVGGGRPLSGEDLRSWAASGGCCWRVMARRTPTS